MTLPPRMAELFATYSATCDALQQRIVEIDNEPNQGKVLRGFNLREVAGFLGQDEGEVRRLPAALPLLKPGGRLSLDELRALHGRAPPAAPPRVVSIANFKGGAAKTTTAVHLAQYLSLRGYRVLMIDLDSQASATSLFGFQPDRELQAEDTLWAFLRGDVSELAPLLRPTHWAGIDLLPANLGLYQAEFELPILQRTQPDFRFWRLLERGIAGLEGTYDVIVCDCPPSLGYLSINALFAATGLIVPSPASMLDFASTGRFFQMMADTLNLIEDYEHEPVKRLAFVRILISRYNTADRNQQTLVDWMQQTYRDQVLENRMALTTALDLAGNIKRTIYELEPGTSRALERALDYLNAVNAELERLIMGGSGEPRP